MNLNPVNVSIQSTPFSFAILAPNSDVTIVFIIVGFTWFDIFSLLLLITYSTNNEPT